MTKMFGAIIIYLFLWEWLFNKRERHSQRYILYGVDDLSVKTKTPDISEIETAAFLITN
jgi:hypothetical protein